MKAAGVIGLGLIGGSIARELVAQGVRVLGWDRDAAQLHAALADGGITAALGPDWSGIEDVDAAILAVPPGAAPEVLRALAPRLAGVRLVTDAASTKQSVVRAARDLGIGARFVGSHPLAGDHRSGWGASRLGLFKGARVFLCPTEQTEGAAVAAAHALWTGFGARTEVVDAAEHDRGIAWTSHLPQVVSSALAVALARAGVGPAALGPGGRDVTRLAGSSPELWADIARDNAAELGAACRVLQGCLAEWERAIAAHDPDQIHALFAAGNRWAREGRTAEG